MAKKIATKPEGQISSAKLSHVRLGPQRARLVVDLIRGKHVAEALDILKNSDKKTAPILRKLIWSAISNAKTTASVDIDELFIKRAWVDEGRTLRRSLPRAQGRATPIRKRHSTITVVLDEIGGV